MIVLGIDTSCYTTSVAAADENGVLASNRQLLPVQAGARGLRQSEAVFAHVRQLPALYEKTLSNLVEVKSRGAYLMGLTACGRYALEDTADFTVYIPQTDAHFAPSLAVIPLQLLAYYVSVTKGLDVDKPRNLAKSVTVE